MTGTVLTVVQSEKTPRQALDRTASILNNVGAKMLGVVLNNVPHRAVASSYGYGYGYRYSYGGSSKENNKNKENNRLFPRVSDFLRRFGVGIRHSVSGKEEPLPSRPIRRDAKSR